MYRVPTAATIFRNINRPIVGVAWPGPASLKQYLSNGISMSRSLELWSTSLQQISFGCYSNQPTLGVVWPAFLRQLLGLKDFQPLFPWSSSAGFPAGVVARSKIQSVACRGSLPACGSYLSTSSTSRSWELPDPPACSSCHSTSSIAQSWELPGQPPVVAIVRGKGSTSPSRGLFGRPNCSGCRLDRSSISPSPEV